MGNPIRGRSSSRNSLTQTMIDLHHTYSLSPNQCSSRLVQKMDSPVLEVWSIIRRFENPQAYKPFIRSCAIRGRRIGVGSSREVTVISGLPAENSIERLDRLDDCDHVMSFTITGGDHRLKNYHSTITAHEEEEEEEEEGRGKKTVVIESYVVDVPDGSNEEDTRLFADTIVGCNLTSLARVVEQKGRNWRAR